MPFNIRRIQSKGKPKAPRCFARVTNLYGRRSTGIESGVRAPHTVYLSPRNKTLLSLSPNGVLRYIEMAAAGWIGENFIIALYAIDYRPREFYLTGWAPQHSVHLALYPTHPADVASYNFHDFV